MTETQVLEIFGAGLANEVEMIVCTQDKNQNYLNIDAVETAKNEVASVFTRMFGGATIQEASGTWLNNGQLEAEKNYLISASISDEDFTTINLETVKSLAIDLKDFLNQDCISLKVNSQRYFI